MSSSISTIPASFFVNVIPGVIGAGGSELTLVELMLTTNIRVPVGTVYSFPDLAAVQSFFGATSDEASAAAVYFAGFTNCTTLPAALLFAQYPTANVGAYLRGGNVSALTLTQLQALSGVLTISIDGTPHTSSTINLAATTSFSNAAQLITNGLGLTGPTQAVVTGSFGASFTGTASTTNLTTTAVTGVIHVGDTITGTGVPASTTIVSQTSGTPGGAGVYITSQATTASSASITSTSTTVDVTAVSSGTISIGQEVTGSGVTAGTFVTALGTGTGGVGTYVTTTANHVASETLTNVMPTCTYDSQSGAFIIVSSTTGASSTIGFCTGTLSTSLKLTSATGAVTSQGAITAVPGTFMAAIIAITQNWATFQTLFDPDAGSGNAQKQLFAAWVNSTTNRYCYLAWDNDITPTESTAATSSLGYILNQSNSSGTACIYEPTGQNLHLAAFLGGIAASINFNATNGRTTAAYRTQQGLVASVTNSTAAANLIANKYNFQALAATAAQDWDFFYNGSVTGPFSWFDSYINQIWLNNLCQSALLTLLTQLGSIPYNPQGYGYIRGALTAGADNFTQTPPPSPVAAALNFGAIRQNVPLSSTEIQAVNALAGIKIDQILATVGWYLVIQPATAMVRAARQSPTIILLYMDGQSIQSIDMSSILVQ